jgi:hypothetical protein
MTEPPSAPSFDVDFDGGVLVGGPVFECTGPFVGKSWWQW